MKTKRRPKILKKFALTVAKSAVLLFVIVRGTLGLVFRTIRFIYRWARLLLAWVMRPVINTLKPLAKFLHHHTARRPHEFLARKSNTYRRYHDWRWHHHLHLSVLALYIVTVVFIAASYLQPVFALSTWTQADWSGGVGASTTTQYSAASNISGASGSVSLSTTEKLSNTGFETDLTGWAPLDDTLVQSKSGTANSASSISVSYNTMPTANNLLVAVWNGTADGGGFLSSPIDSGWTLGVTDAGATNQPLTNLYYKVSAGTESTVSFTTVTSLLNHDLHIYEFKSIVTTSPLDVVSSANSGSSGPATISTGTTATTAQASNLVFTARGANGGIGIASWTNSPTAAIDTSRLGTGYKTVNAVGTHEATANGGSSRRLVAEIAVFKEDRSLTRDTVNSYAGTASAKLVAGPNHAAHFTQSLNVGDTNNYIFEAYAKTDGTAVTSGDIQLYYDGNAISTTYASAGNGWYKISATVTGVATLKNYGLEVKAGKTVYVDNVSVRSYAAAGNLTSNIFDTGQLSSWDVITYGRTNLTGTWVSIKVRSSDDAAMSGAPDFSTCNALVTNADLSSNNCVTDGHRYIQYNLEFTTSDTSKTSTISWVTINYAAYDNGPPVTNASAIQMSKSNGGASVSSNGWTNGASPFFSWTAGADEVGGSGIQGYCLYLGQDSTGDPITTKGLLGTSPLNTAGTCQFAVSGTSIDLAASGYLATPLSSSTSPYYLNIKAIDNVNNVYAGTSAQFQLRFDNTLPSNPAYLISPAQFSASESITVTWPTGDSDSASDSHSGIAGLQYRIGSGGTWYGDTHNGNQDSSDLLLNDGSYTTNHALDHTAIVEGNNTFYIRTWDAAGNMTTTYSTAVLKVNTSSPSQPLNVDVTPATNTTNSFAFNWDPPSSYVGSASSLTYCYTVNTLPSVNTCTFTAAGTTSLSADAYATQPGENTLFVIAKDEAGNINYATYNSITFAANTSAPGVPLNVDAADISVKSTSNWKLTISWEAPTETGAGVANYRIYRSTDGTSFTQAATTSGASFVDTNLSEVTYYYKIAACDSANNCGAYSAVVNKKPTGKFTEAASLIGQVQVSGISTRKATVTWTTERESDSRVAIGLASGDYLPTESAASAQSKTHSIELNSLTAGTTYYLKAKWTDVDGNLGVSSEVSFTTEPAPTIKEVTTKNVNLSVATIQFTSTGAHKVKIYYGKSEGFGGSVTQNTSASESTYAIELTGLDDGTKHFFKVNTFDSDGNEYDGNIFSFSTPAKPRITNLRFQPLEDEPTSTQKISWTTNVPSTSVVSYGLVGGAAKEQIDSSLVTEHEIIVRGLLDNSQYVLTAQSRDSAGNLAVSDQQVFLTDLDTRPPKVAGVAVEDGIRGTGSEARGQVVVSWTTDEPSTSQVAYGEGVGGSTYTTTTVEDNNLVTDHIVIVSDLPTSRTFHLKTLSRDKAGNQGESEDYSTIIGRPSESVIGIIFNALQKVFSFLQ